MHSQQPCLWSALVPLQDSNYIHGEPSRGFFLIKIRFTCSYAGFKLISCCRATCIFPCPCPKTARPRSPKLFLRLLLQSRGAALATQTTKICRCGWLEILCKPGCPPTPSHGWSPLPRGDAQCCCTAASAPSKALKSELPKYKRSPKHPRASHPAHRGQELRPESKVQGPPLQKEDTAPEPELTTQLIKYETGHECNETEMVLPHGAGTALDTQKICPPSTFFPPRHSTRDPFSGSDQSTLENAIWELL